MSTENRQRPISEGKCPTSITARGCNYVLTHVNPVRRYEVEAFGATQWSHWCSDSLGRRMRDAPFPSTGKLLNAAE
jgi:hypothetical protein